MIPGRLANFWEMLSTTLSYRLTILFFCQVFLIRTGKENGQNCSLICFDFLHFSLYFLWSSILLIFIQIKNILAPTAVDSKKEWKNCKLDLKKCSATQLQTVQSNFENLCSFINDQIWEVLGKFFVRDGEVKLSLSAWWPTKSFIFRL
jgi:uncharacterized protein with PQ loop repeat